MKSPELQLPKEQKLALTIWDSREAVNVSEGVVYTWDGYSENAAVKSLFRYVESNAERLRARYAEWIHDLGEFSFGGKRVIDHLAIYPDLSYWWLTLLVEKSPWKSPAIVDAIRVLALEEILTATSPSHVVLVSGNVALDEVISALCRELKIEFTFRQIEHPPSPWGKRKIYRSLPPAVRGLVHLAIHSAERWAFRKTGKPKWFNSEGTLFFCSYFFNIEVAEARRGHFKSRNWGDLPELLQRLDLKANWLEHFPAHPAIPTPSAAMGYASELNKHAVTEGRHNFLDSFLSLHLLGRVLARWIQLFIASRRLKRVKPGFRPRGSSVSLWPLLRGDWFESLHGVDCVRALLARELLEAAVASLPPKSKGFYLCENHAWERAFIQAWRRHSHSTLTAVAHSTVRFWDLRYFHDRRTLESKGILPLPQTDVTVLNGNPAVHAYKEMGYSIDRIAKGEALRYSDLKKLPRTTAARDPRFLKVLVLGDYIPAQTAKLLRLVAEASVLLPSTYSYTVKPHPNCVVNLSDYPSLPLTIQDFPLADVLGLYDVAFSSNWTSASVDAYVAGLPVAVMLDDTEVNLSPMRGMSGVRFVSDAHELAGAMTAAAAGTLEENPEEELFFLDPSLPLWRDLVTS